MPTFLVVGAQKAGTTWLSECLTEHPQIFVPAVKEVHFFLHREDDRLTQRDRGERWYRGNFPDGGYAAYGELTPDYMFFPYAAAEIAAFNPALRIVFLLREPVARAHSAYRMKSRNNRLAPFRDEVRRSPALLERGLYFPQIERFLKVFPREQVRVYIYEEATRDPEGFIADLFAFIGVDPAFRPRSLHQRIGETKPLQPWASFVFYKVLSPILNARLVKDAWRFLRGRTRIKERVAGVLNSLSIDSPTERLSVEDRAAVAGFFAAENARLEEFLGREITAWRNR